MSEEKQPYAKVFQKWRKSFRKSVPDPEERCLLYEFIIDYQLALIYGSCDFPDENVLTPIARTAFYNIEDDLQHTTSSRKEHNAKRAENGRKSVQAAANPSAPVCTGTDNPLIAPNSPYINTNTNTNTNTETITKIDFVGLLGEKKSLLEIGLDLLDKGHKIKADTIRTAAAKYERGEIRKDIGAYLAGCFRDMLFLPDSGHALANMLRAIGFQSLECLECYGIDVDQNGVLQIYCSERAQCAIEAEFADHQKADKMQKYMQAIGAQTINYKIAQA